MHLHCHRRHIIALGSKIFFISFGNDEDEELRSRAPPTFRVFISSSQCQTCIHVRLRGRRKLAIEDSLIG